MNMKVAAILCYVPDTMSFDSASKFPMGKNSDMVCVVSHFTRAIEHKEFRPKREDSYV